MIEQIFQLNVSEKSLQTWILIFFCFLSILIAYLLTFSVKLILGIVLFSFVLIFFYFFPNKALDIAIIGAFFDEIDFNMGFAKFGLGDLGLFALLGIWSTQNLFGRFPKRSINRLPRGSILLICYLFLMAISMYLGPSYSSVYGRYFRLITYILGVFVIADSIRDLKTLKRCLNLIIISGFINAIAAFFIDDASANRFEGLAYQSNILAFTLGVALILMFGYLTQSIRHLSIVLIALMVPTIIAFFLAGSRSATIAMMLTILWYYKSHWRGFLIVGFIIFAGILITSQIAPDRFDVLSKRFRFDANDGSVADRQKILSYRIGLIIKYPFFGQGFDQLDLSRNVDKNTNIAHKGSHNNYVGMSSSNGLLPTSILLIFILYQMQDMWRLKKKLLQTSDENQNQSHRQRQKDFTMVLSFLQMLFIFQSIALLFRGACRMLDWTPLALYCAIIMLIEEFLKNNDQSDKQVEIQALPHHTSTSPKSELA